MCRESWTCSHCRFPIANCRFCFPIANCLPRGRLQLAIGDWQSEIQKPRAKHAGLCSNPFRLVLLKTRRCCLADYFTWPQVALTHHVCSEAIETSPVWTVKQLTSHFWSNYISGARSVALHPVYFADPQHN